MRSTFASLKETSTYSIFFIHKRKKIFLLFSSQSEEREMENKSFSTNMFFFSAVKTAKCGRHVTSEDLCF